MNTNRYYLAYGMNTNKQEMARRCPKSKSLGTVKLKGHKLAFKQFCDIEADSNKSMDCVLWEITPDCERALDVLEGFPNFYRKKEVAVKFNGRQILAMIYYMTDFYKVDYPSEYYLKTVVNGYLDHGLETHQIEQALEEVDAHRSGK